MNVEKEKHVNDSMCPVCWDDKVEHFYTIRGCHHKICTMCEPTLRHQGVFIHTSFNAIKCPLCRKIEDIPYQQFLLTSWSVSQTQPPPTYTSFSSNNNNEYIDFMAVINANQDTARIIPSSIRRRSLAGRPCERCGIRTNSPITNRRCPYHLNVYCCNRCNICTVCDRTLLLGTVRSERI
jgi:hypothetical protein